MEKRSRRRIRDLVTHMAFQGLVANEIGCARISMMARGLNAPSKGRIQMRKTNHLHIVTSSLQRTAGPYIWVKSIVFDTLRHVRFTPNSDRLLRCREMTLCADFVAEVG